MVTSTAQDFASSRGLLQICSNDGPPFADLCQAYSAAANSLGVRCHTIYLTTPISGRGQPPAGSHISHLHLDDTTNHSVAAERLSQANPFPNPPLILCHRYRSYRVARAAGLPQARTIAVAHEFGLLRRWQRRLDRLLSARALRFAGVSPAVVADLARSVPNVLLLPNIIDWGQVERQQFDSAAARSRLAIPPGRFCIGVVGRLHPKKRPQLAIEAIKALTASQPQAELLFIGDGALRADLEQQAAGLPVRFTGFVADARRYFSGLDALLMTSSAAEAFGMVALEALTLGLPVVAPDVPGIRSVLDDLGFYASSEPSGAELAAALSDVVALYQRGDLAHWRAAARTRVRREFSITAAAQRLQHLLEPAPI